MPSSTCRSEGCSLTGALSVTTAVRGAVSLVHGPEGCAHHTSSLLFSQFLEQGDVRIPPVHSTCLPTEGVIFGGEEYLRSAIKTVLARSPSLVFLLSSCVSDMIGDDCDAVAAEFQGAPVIPVASGGFLGGSFNDGVEQALMTIVSGITPGEPQCGEVCLVGEKNLEFEAEAQYSEVRRLLLMLGLTPSVRLVRDACLEDIRGAGNSSLFIQREPGLSRVGEYISRRFSAPVISSFPAGFAGTLAFLRQAGEAAGVDPGPAIREEQRHQKSLLEEFANLRGIPAALPGDNHGLSFVLGSEIADLLNLPIRDGAPPLPVGDPFPVGTTGVARVLHRWRRMVRA